MRSYLRNPIGFLVSGEELKKSCPTFGIIISIGDHVTASLINNNIFPQLMIIDNKTRRGSISEKQKILLNQPNYLI